MCAYFLAAPIEQAEQKEANCQRPLPCKIAFSEIIQPERIIFWENHFGMADILALRTRRKQKPGRETEGTKNQHAKNLQKLFWLAIEKEQRIRPLHHTDKRAQIKSIDKRNE